MSPINLRYYITLDSNNEINFWLNDKSIKDFNNGFLTYIYAQGTKINLYLYLYRNRLSLISPDDQSNIDDLNDKITTGQWGSIIGDIEYNQYLCTINKFNYN